MKAYNRVCYSCSPFVPRFPLKTFKPKQRVSVNADNPVLPLPTKSWSFVSRSQMAPPPITEKLCSDKMAMECCCMNRTLWSVVDKFFADYGIILTGNVISITFNWQCMIRLNVWVVFRQDFGGFLIIMHHILTTIGKPCLLSITFVYIFLYE